MITIPNAVLLAVAQVGLMVIGVLAGGLARRVAGFVGPDRDPELSLPFWNILLVDFWALWLLAPLAWVIMAVVVLNKPHVVEQVKRQVFGAGFVLLGALVLLIFVGGCAPLVQCCGHRMGSQ